MAAQFLLLRMAEQGSRMSARNIELKEVPVGQTTLFYYIYMSSITTLNDGSILGFRKRILRNLFGNLIATVIVFFVVVVEATSQN